MPDKDLQKELKEAEKLAKAAAQKEKEAAKAAAQKEKEAAKAAAMKEKEAAKAAAMKEKEAAKAAAMAEKAEAMKEKEAAKAAAAAQKAAFLPVKYLIIESTVLSAFGLQNVSFVIQNYFQIIFRFFAIAVNLPLTGLHIKQNS